MKDIIRQWVNLLATIGMIVVNSLAVILPLNGQTTGQIAGLFKVYFVPEAYVFSIWGLIYLLLVGFAIYQLLPSQRENPNLRKIGYWYALTCALNSAWIFLWHYNQFGWSLLAMLGILACLLAVYLKLGVNRLDISSSERFFTNVPFSVYLGWITVATIANASSVLYWIGWDGWGVSPEAWTVIMLVATVCIGLLVAFTRKDVVYPLVLVWALIGIALKYPLVPLVSVTARVAAAIIALSSIIEACVLIFAKPKNAH